MTIKPIGNRLLVNPLKVEEKTKSGILLASSIEQEPKAQGTVIAIGGGDETKNFKGHTVVYSKYSGDPITIDEDGVNKEYIILAVADVLAIIV